MDDRAYILWTLADWAYIILAPIVLKGASGKDFQIP